MFGKMTAGEKSARALFDTAMKLNNLNFGKLGLEGDKNQLFNFDALSKMTKEDLPLALETLSKMYVKGQLNTQTMQKMFTARHFMEISNLLLDINGNTDEFVNKIAKGVNYSNDFAKKMFDINEQIKMAKNNLSAGMGGVGFDLSKSTTGVLMKLNEIMSSDGGLSKGLGAIVSQLGTMTLVLGGVSLASGIFIKTLTPLLVAGGGIGLAIGAVVLGVGVLGKRFYDANKNLADLNINMGKTLLLNKQLESEVRSIDNMYATTVRTMKEAQKNQMNVIQIEEASTMMGLLLGKSKDYVEMLEAIDKSKAISTSMLKIKDLNAYKIGSSDETYGDIKKQAIKNISESNDIIAKGFNGMRDKINTQLSGYQKQVNDKLMGQSSFDLLKEGLDIKLDRTKKIYDKYVELLSEGLPIGKIGEDTDTVMGKLTQFGKTINSSKYEIEEVLQAIDQDTIVKNVDAKTSSLDKLKLATEAVKDGFKELNEQITANNKSINMLTAFINNLNLEEFMDTGEYRGKNGAEGIFNMFVEGEISDFNSKIRIARKGLDEIKSKLKEFETLESENIPLTEQQVKDKEDLLKLEKEQLSIVEGSKSMKKSILDIDKDGILTRLQDVKLTDDMVMSIVKLLELKSKLSETVLFDPDNKIEIKKIEEAIEKMFSKIDRDSKNLKAKERATTYQLKYGNYLKESLDLELESLKVGKSKAEQEYLTYTYKLKQLELDRKIAEETVKVSKEDLKSSKAGSFEKYRQMALGAGSARELQSILDTIFQTESKVRKGEAGAEEKAFVDTLKSAIQSQVKYEGILQNIDILPKETINKFKMDTLPDLNQSIVSMLKDSFDLTGISLVNADKLNLDNMRQELLDLVRQTSLEGLELLPFDQLNQKILDKRKDVLDAIQQAEVNSSQENSDILKKEQKELEDLLEIQAKKLGIAKEELQIELKKLSVYDNMGNVLSSLGSGMNIKGLESIGDIFSGLGKYSATNLEKKFKFGDLFDFKADDFADKFGNAMANALDSIDLGSTIGSWIGSITGGGASSQAGGSLGGLIGGLGGADALSGLLGISTGGASMAISAGMSLIGGLFDSGEGDQEEANKRTAEAKKIYDKNTEALNKLAQNMSNLSGGVDGLNSSLISAFSKLPTFGNLTDVTGAMKDLYSTMEKTRKFNDVAYQVTKTKKGSSGFLGIGAKAGSTWTETIEISVQEMLNKYGFKGAIEDMTTNQLRDFSKWLEDFDMGDSDNFSILAGAIEDYAEALDKFDKNIENFFYDTTMESFAGISSLQQEELRQQLEDFYKNMGFQIDEEISKIIDDLADQMSVMVTIMQDVRGQFVNSWRDSGKDAGSAFLSSMTPFIDAMLENISQVFYDVYFSDVTDVLSDEFKALSEQLVELKKQGADLDWGSVAGGLSGSFDKVLNAIISAKQETESFNDIILALQKQALEAGLTLSEMLELGLVSGTQKNVLDSFKDALLSSDSESALASIGQMVGDKIGGALADKMLDNMLSDKILEFSANIDKIASGNLSFDSLAGIASEAMSVGMMLSQQQKRLEAVRDLFNFDKDIVYDAQESNINYQTGTSSQIVNNYFLNSTIEAGNVVESDSIERLADSLLDTLIEKLRVDRGIDITKNY